MESISYSILTAERLGHFIDSELKATGNRVTNDQEALESQRAKAHAMTALHGAKSMVNSALASLRSVGKRPSPGRMTASDLGIGESRASAVLGAASKGTVGALPDRAQSLVNAMSSSAEGLGGQTKTLVGMATSIEPIVKSFDEVLKQPFLNQFSASLNTAPVVGIKNNQVMYLATLPSVTSKTGVKNDWAYFSALPNGVTVEASTNVHLFPYKGSLFISVGRAVWKKQCRDLANPDVRQQAVDNWPKMYVDQWQKIGDEVLPSADLLDVIPYAVLSADRSSIDFRLLTLGADRAVQLLKSDEIYPSNEWTFLQYQPKVGPEGKAPLPLPVWTRMAYWNDSVAALDDQGNSWDVQPNFQNGTYTIGNPTPTEPTSEFTATDLGPVAVRGDGFLYNRVVKSNDGTDPQLVWERGVAQDGVTKLGVASPGVLLDLRTLTATLKSRYLDTQTAVYPLVNKVNAFAKTHTTYLDQLLGAADDYVKAGDDEEKQRIAIEAGKKFVGHAKVWAKLLGKASDAAKTTVNIMTNQLFDVKSQLEVQLTTLWQSLAKLEAKLKSQQESLSKLEAVFWGSVAAMFLGMILGVVALATGLGAWALAGAGALFVVGLVGTIAMGFKMSELAGEMADTRGQIDATNTAISELSSVVKNFSDLDAMYHTLNQFWGRMIVDAASLQTMDDATAEMLGALMFEDTSAIVTAKSTTAEMDEAALKYLDVLNEQGVIVPPENNSSHLFNAHLSNAHRALVDSDLASYETYMELAFSAEAERAAAANLRGLRSGVWYDIAHLNASSALFDPASLPRPAPASLADSALADASASAAVENRIKTAAPVVVAMLLKTHAMCTAVQDICLQYEHSPSATAALERMLDSAILDCAAAQRYAAQANNAFVDVNHACQQYQQDVQAAEGRQDANMNAARASAAQTKRTIEIPWYVYLGGVPAVLIYQAEREHKIDQKLDAKLRELSVSIDALKRLEESGATLNGHALTWTDMVTTVSGCLGGVYNILTAVSGQILEDPTLYQTLINIEWSNIQTNTDEVLNILASKGVDTSPGANAAAFARPRPRPQTATVGSDRVVSALKAPANLEDVMGSQAQQAERYFAEMETLMELPNLPNIVGYWDDGQTTKASLLDVVCNLHRQYVDMMAAQYPVVQTLHDTSLLQKTKAGLVQEGRLKLDILIRTSLKAAENSLRSALAARAKFETASAGYMTALKQIEANLRTIQQKLADTDKSIKNLEQQERDKIICIVADVVALTLATAVILASAGAFGPVAVAMTTAVKIGLSAAATAAAVKLAVDGLDLDDVEELLGTLRGVKQDMDAALQSLKAVQPIFANVVKAANGFDVAIATMVEGLEAVQDDAAKGEVLALSEEDVARIKDSWDGVDGACLLWMDVVNGQGIVPAI